ncbi:MAG: hypothetical protein Q8R39_04300 [bacterium]|nr:hypothetical protein [bacterium]MDZ4284589.1 hypothetical protein [Patescibacteria group bacterium]
MTFYVVRQYGGSERRLQGVLVVRKSEYFVMEALISECHDTRLKRVKEGPIADRAHAIEFDLGPERDFIPPALQEVLRRAVDDGCMLKWMVVDENPRLFFSRWDGRYSTERAFTEWEEVGKQDGGLEVVRDYAEEVSRS